MSQTIKELKVKLYETEDRLREAEMLCDFRLTQVQLLQYDLETHKESCKKRHVSRKPFLQSLYLKRCLPRNLYVLLIWVQEVFFPIREKEGSL